MSNRFSVVFLGGSLFLAAFAAIPAVAQEGDIVQQSGEVEQVAPVDEVDRVVGPPRGSLRAPEGVRVVSPGALLFASFDRNYDGRITADEIEAGAIGSFAVADRNGDGVLSGFEQSDWAELVGGGDDVLSNPMTFDVDLDRSVTRTEFVDGIRRLAGQTGPRGIAFADLVRPLNRQDQQAARGGENPGVSIERGRGSNVGVAP